MNIKVLPPVKLNLIAVSAQLLYREVMKIFSHREKSGKMSLEQFYIMIQKYVSSKSLSKVPPEAGTFSILFIFT